MGRFDLYGVNVATIDNFPIGDRMEVIIDAMDEIHEEGSDEAAVALEAVFEKAQVLYQKGLRQIAQLPENISPYDPRVERILRETDKMVDAFLFKALIGTRERKGILVRYLDESVMVGRIEFGRIRTLYKELNAMPEGAS